MHSHPFILQAVSFEDYPSLQKLALKYPLLNLPAEKHLLNKKIETSINSFNESLIREKRNFLFVLKTKEGEVIGSSQISVKSGTVKNPSYSLKIMEKNKKCLCLKKITDGPSYLGGLILDMRYRGQAEKLGKQLSLIRFLFVGVFPHFFENIFHAELAPFLDKNGKNPFFEHFIQKSISLSMKEIDYLTLTNKEKLFAHYPRELILWSALPKGVQKTLGQPGLFSQRALALLERQGFRFVGEVDPFDGGPYLQAQLKDIPVIQNIKKVSVKLMKNKTKPEKKAKASLDGEKKWLFARPCKNNFKGGVLKGILKGKTLFVSSDSLHDFGLKSASSLFVSPF